MSIYKTQQFHLTTVDFVVLKDFLIYKEGLGNFENRMKGKFCFGTTVKGRPRSKQ